MKKLKNFRVVLLVMFAATLLGVTIYDLVTLTTPNSDTWIEIWDNTRPVGSQSGKLNVTKLQDWALTNTAGVDIAAANLPGNLSRILGIGNGVDGDVIYRDSTGWTNFPLSDLATSVDLSLLDGSILNVGSAPAVGAVWVAADETGTNAQPSGATISVDGHFVANTVTTGSGNVDSRITVVTGDIEGLEDALISFQTQNQVIAAQWEMQNLILPKVPIYTITTNTGTAFEYDWTGPPVQLRLVGGDTTRTAINAPTGDAKWGPIEILIADEITNCSLSQIEGHVLFGRLTVGGIVPTEISPNTVIFYQALYTPHTTWFFWRGNQDSPLSGVLGGRERTNLAEEKISPTPDTTGGSNTYSADLDGGLNKEFRITGAVNMHIGNSSGRAVDTSDAIRTHWRGYNSAVANKLLSFRAEWNTIGFDPYPYTISNGMYYTFDVVSEGPNESDMWVYNTTRNLTVIQAIAGGAPASTLPDNLVAYWKLNETTGSSSNDEIGTYDLGTYGTAWNKNFTIVNAANTTPGWTNTVTTSVLTNGAAALELGRSGGDMSAAIIVAPYAIGTVYGIMGEWEEATGNNRSWRVRVNVNGTVTFFVSSDGINVSTSVTSVTTLAANTRSLIVVALDQTANLIKISINGETYRTSAYSLNFAASAAPFAVGGTGESSAYISLRGAYDQPALWNDDLSQSEVSELWNSGNILDLSTL